MEEHILWPQLPGFATWVPAVAPVLCPGSQMRSAHSARDHGAGGILGNDSGLKPRKFPSLRQPQNQSKANARASHSSDCLQRHRPHWVSAPCQSLLTSATPCSLLGSSSDPQGSPRPQTMTAVDQELPERSCSELTRRLGQLGRTASQPQPAPWTSHLKGTARGKDLWVQPFCK